MTDRDVIINFIDGCEARINTIKESEMRDLDKRDVVKSYISDVEVLIYMAKKLSSWLYDDEFRPWWRRKK